MKGLFFCDHVETLYKHEKNLKKYEELWLITNSTAVVNDEIVKRINASVYLVDSDEKICNEETWDIIKKINEVIDSTHTNYGHFLYEISYLIEGGAASDINDTLFYINYILKIFNNRIADEYGCDSINSPMFNAIECISSTFGKKMIHLSIKDNMKEWVKCTNLSYYYRNYRTIKNIIKIRKGGNSSPLSDEIWILHSSDATKHIEWQKECIETYMKDFNYRIICINAPLANANFNENRINSVNLEDIFHCKIIPSAIWNSNIDIRKIVKTIENNFKVNYKGIDITKKIKEICLKYIKTCSLKNVIYYLLLNKFLKYNDTRLLTGDGDSNNVLNRTAYECSKENKKYIKIFKETASGSVFAEESFSIYEPNSNIFSFRIFHEKSILESIYRKQGWMGHAYYSNRINDTSSRYNKYEILNTRIKVLWAPSYPFVGVYSFSDFSHENGMILEGANKIGYDLTIKYHPNHPSDIISEIKNKLPLYVKLVDKNLSIHECINACDVIITTPSTVIYDGMRAHKPVVCIVSDNTFSYVSHMMEVILIVNCKEMDINRIIDYVKDNYYEIVDKQDIFLKEYYYTKPDTSISEIIRMELDKSHLHG